MRLTKWIVVFLVVLSVGVLTSCSEVPEVAVFDYARAQTLENVKIAAHRGVTVYHPDNSLSAIARAVEIGADAVEFDLRLSADGEFMLLHDEDLVKIAGVTGRVEDYTAAQLHSLRLKNRNGLISQEGLTSLREVLDVVANRIHCYIEVKQFYYDDWIVADKLNSIIRAYGVEESVTVFSFDNNFLRNLHWLNSKIQVTLLLWNRSQFSFNGVSWGEYDHLKGVCINQEGLDLKTVIDLKDCVGEVSIFTLNSYNGINAEMYNYLEAVITDYPEEWLALKGRK